MQNYCKTIGALAAASALVAGNASAEVEYELHTGYSSMYLWRGLDLGDDLVEVGADVATEWNGLGLSAGAWYASFEAPTGFNNPVSDANTNELDIYGEVSKDLGFLTAAVGYIYYYFPQGSANKTLVPLDDSQEVYFSVARDFGFLNASLTYFWDIETDNDGYTELGLDRSFELNQCLTLNTGGALGYLWEEGQLAHFTAKVSLDWAFVENAKLSPFVAASWDLNGDNDTSYGQFGLNAKNYVQAGLMLSASF